jgi:sigma-E factor negative regulatory protein RseA
MTDRLREQISALADNELPENEHELLLRRFAGERSLRLCWERYHLVGEAMRKTLPAVDTRGLADRVMASISQEAAPAQAATGRRALGRAAAGVAVAVSVAVAAVVGLRNDDRVQQSVAGAPAEIVPQESALQAVSNSPGLVSGASWDGSAPQVQASLRSYLVNHDVMTAALTRQVTPPYRDMAPAPYLPAGDKLEKQSKAVKKGVTPRHP